MKIVTTLFGSNPKWERLLGAFVCSVDRNCPNATLEVIHSDPPQVDDLRGLPPHCYNNTAKLHQWRAAVYEATDDLVLMDCDTVILQDISEVFERNFDIAYTARDAPSRVNAGVIFVRPNAASKRFFDDWVEENDKILRSQPFCLYMLSKYWGINQAAFARTLDRGPRCNVLALPCEVYNVTQEYWHRLNGKAAVLHIKSKLRDLAVGGMEPTDEACRPSKEAFLWGGAKETDTIRPALDVWRRFDPEQVDNE